MKMNKKTLNTAVFFTILYWIGVYFLAIKNKIVVDELTGTVWLVIAAINLVLVLCSPFLHPVFDFVLFLTGKLGSLIFGIITTVVYYFILTPIALVKRNVGTKLMHVKIDREADSYYEEWEPSEKIEKQF